MINKTDFYIDGKWVAPQQGTALEVIDPSTEDAFATISLGGEADTNAAVAKHYLNKLVGDSPEFCPLDSNLFSDFEFAMRQNLAHTYWLPHDHPDKWLCCYTGC